jgi:hypothetical protein
MQWLRGRITVVLLSIVTLAGCGSDTTGPEGRPTFTLVRQTFEANCSACHGSGSGRFFQVSMDSAALQGSGLVDPSDPANSLVILKPTNAIPHGGGLIGSYTAAQQAGVKEWIAQLPPVGASVLEAVKLGAGTPPPTIDGFFDQVWDQAAPVLLRITGGWGEADFVSVKAAYDQTYLYMLVTWDDDRASMRRQPWVKQSDATWKTIAAKPLPTVGQTWADYIGTGLNEEDSTRFNYEDKLAIMWNTYGASTVAGFDQSGCASTCHDPTQGNRPGTAYNYTEQWKASKKYTNAPAEIADLWHWKLVRNNQHYKLDDQYVRYWVPGPTGAADGGRAGDAGAAGYGDNVATNGKPTYRGATMTAPPYYILDSQKLLLTDAERDALAVGAQIASMITSGPTGNRGDIDARGVHNPAAKMWNLEIRRKLVTGDPTDVQFDDLTRGYAFGVAVFDNAQIEHRYMPLVARLTFKR